MKYGWNLSKADAYYEHGDLNVCVMLFSPFISYEAHPYNRHRVRPRRKHTVSRLMLLLGNQSLLIGRHVNNTVGGKPRYCALKQVVYIVTILLQKVKLWSNYLLWRSIITGRNYVWHLFACPVEAPPCMRHADTVKSKRIVELSAFDFIKRRCINCRDWLTIAR
jgi:hypothetical protein